MSRRIEAVITGLTRNQFVGNHTWVRIPPSAFSKSLGSKPFPGVFTFAKSVASYKPEDRRYHPFRSSHLCEEHMLYVVVQYIFS